MLRIRLTRVGKKNSPAYRIVIADRRRAVKRKFIEIIGHYNPIQTPKEIVIDKERALFWMGNGAQPSDTVRNLMCDLGILNKKDKVNKVYGKKLSKKAIKAGPAKEKPAEVVEKASETEKSVPEEAETPVETVETVAEEATEIPAEEVAEAPAVEDASPEKVEDETAKVTEPEATEKSK